MAQIFRCTISGDLFGELFQNVIHLETENDTLIAQDVALEVRNQFVGQELNVGVKSWISNSVKWTSVHAARIWPTPGLGFTHTFSQGGQQQQNPALLMMGSFLLRYQSNVPGRAGRGRSYIPGMHEAFLTNGRLNATFNQFADTAIAGLRTRFIKDFNPALAGPLFLVVAGRLNPGERGLVLSLTVSDKAGTQRRRNFA